MDRGTTEFGAVASDGRDTRAALLAQGAVACAVPSVSVVLHELGHHSAHVAFGYSRRSLSYDGASAGVPPAGVDARLADGVSFAAATLVSLALVVAAFLPRVPRRLAVATIAFECVRATIGLILSLGNKGIGALWGGVGELRYLARAFDLPVAAGVALQLVELGVPVAAATMVLRRVPSGIRWQVAAVSVLGSLVGLGVWLGALGPLVLP